MECKIEIRHSCIIIHNYMPGDYPALERTFSVYDKLYHRYFMKILYYDEENKDLYIPSGIDLDFLAKRYHGEVALRKLKPDYYDKIPRTKIKYKPRDERQQKAIDFCLGNNKYWRNKNASQISLNLNTGAGKTFVAIYATCLLSMKTMMITSSLSWINQWKDKILEYCPSVRDDEIYIISGSGSIAQLLGGIQNINKIKFYLVSIDTFRAYATRFGWDKLRELFQKLKIGTKIFDEAHLYFDSICMIDYFSDVCKTFYLTATPMRSDRKENYIYQLSYKNIPKISLFDQENDPRTRYVAFMYSSHPSPSDIAKMHNAYGFDRLKYTEYLSKRPVYPILLDFIVRLIYENTSPIGKALVYIGTNAVIRETCQYLIDRYENISLGVYTSIIPKDKKQEQLNRKIIISTTKSAGVAMDIPNLEMVIVLNEPFKYEGTTRQTLGRTRDRNTVYVDLVDTGFADLMRYYNTKLRVFQKYATSCTAQQLTDKQLDQVQVNGVTQQMQSAMRDNSFRNDKKKVMIFKDDK